MSTQGADPTVLYRAFDEHDELLYVGITQNPRARFNAHLYSPWAVFVERVTFEIYPTRAKARSAELAAIRTETPRWNRASSPKGPHARQLHDRAPRPVGLPSRAQLNRVLTAIRWAAFEATREDWPRRAAEAPT